MIAGQLYDPNDTQLSQLRLIARRRCRELNQLEPGKDTEQRRLLIELFGAGGESVGLEPPFHCDYGKNIFFGRGVYLNFDCVILDVCPVRLGDNVLLGPGVHLYTATHPLDALQRRSKESGKPVTIGSDVWLGGRVVVCPGVTIGPGTVIGAGSVVTRDLPAGVLAAGNPARIIRALNPADRRSEEADGA
ncbi:sugar O-acetyltransferase [Roseiconus nitratireducens]|uniref:Nodulation protein L n=2 Tax=Roseiconus nitratireducens TaxID=2605748 RepID=A0A5M6CYJ8_9BACT|nr:sugar O-acetyltransferase [Roseiconus nitratireducens]